MSDEARAGLGTSLEVFGALDIVFNETTGQLVAEPISKRGEIAYEPFAGSGPQVIAAEMHGRRCYACELEPRFCDVIVARWEKFTGKAAVRADAQPEAAHG